RRAGEAHVAPDRDAAGLEPLYVGPSDRVGALLVDLGRVDASDVVCLEDRGLQHVRMLSRPFVVSTLQGWNASSPRSCSSTWSARPSSSRRPPPRSCGAR